MFTNKYIFGSVLIHFTPIFNVLRTLSHADTLEAIYYFHIRVLLSVLKSMEGASHTNYI